MSRILIFALTLLTLSLAAVACGDDDTADTTADTENAAATTDDQAMSDDTSMSDDEHSGGSDHDGDKKSADSHSTPASGPADTTADVELGEFFVKPSTTELKAGTVKFTISNTGSAEHELQIARKDAIPAGTNIGEMDHDSVHSLSLGAVHGIQPGESGKELTVDLTPGTYILFCDLPGHYAGGQHIEVTVV